MCFMDIFPEKNIMIGKIHGIASGASQGRRGSTTLLLRALATLSAAALALTVGAGPAEARHLGDGWACTDKVGTGYRYPMTWSLSAGATQHVHYKGSGSKQKSWYVLPSSPNKGKWLAYYYYSIDAWWVTADVLETHTGNTCTKSPGSAP